MKEGLIVSAPFSGEEFAFASPGRSIDAGRYVNNMVEQQLPGDRATGPSMSSGTETMKVISEGQVTRRPKDDIAGQAVVVGRVRGLTAPLFPQNEDMDNAPQ